MKLTNFFFFNYGFRLRSKVGEHNLIVASYDIVRNDIEFFRSIKWNYCILDEGHIIKNGKTKVVTIMMFIVILFCIET